MLDKIQKEGTAGLNTMQGLKETIHVTQGT